MFAPVVAPVEAVGAEVDAFVVVWRNDQRGVPVPLQRRIVGFRLRLDVHPFPGAVIEADDPGVLGLGVDDVGVFGVHPRLEAVAAPYVHPVAVEDAVHVDGARGSGHGGVVLGAAIDPVEREVVVDPDPVELGERLVRVVLPVLAEVPALVEPPVGAHHQVVRVVGVELQIVVVHVLPLGVQPPPGPAVVVGDAGVGVHGVEPPGRCGSANISM